MRSRVLEIVRVKASSPSERAGIDPGASQRGSGLAWLWAIVVLGALLRFFPIWFGIPYMRARPDEETALGRAVGHPRRRPQPSLLPLAVVDVLPVCRALQGGVVAVEMASPDPELALAGYTLLGARARRARRHGHDRRHLQIGRRVADTTTGLFAALFLAVAILHVRESHFAMTDVLMTLFATASIAILLRAVDVSRATGHGRWAALVCRRRAAGGLAASTKYSGGAVIAAMAVAQLSLLRRPLTLRTGLPSVSYGLALAAGFLIGTPYAVLDFESSRTDCCSTSPTSPAGTASTSAEAGPTTSRGRCLMALAFRRSSLRSPESFRSPGTTRHKRRSSAPSALPFTHPWPAATPFSSATCCRWCRSCVCRRP